ncbi:MAG: stage II sporulation protein D, partial [Bacillota bacterium]
FLKKISCSLIIGVLILLLIPGLITIFINLISSDPNISVYDYKLKQQRELDLEEYLIGVVAAEMPVSFPQEALKAQAVAARTYALKKKLAGQRLTTTSKLDQAWFSKTELLQRWRREDFLSQWCRIAAAVNETKGLVLSYNGELITAAYHSTSGGQTAAAVEVWGREVPYLQEVNSSYENSSPYYQQQQFFSWAQLSKKLNLSVDDVIEMNIVEASASGRVLKMLIHGQLFSGREIRSKLGLNSTKFDFVKKEQGVEFVVDGFGHGVGMSQYGAQGLARQGYNYRRILEHYYPQTKLIKVEDYFDV